MSELLVNIDVDDLEAAVTFYGAALGFTVGRRFGAAAVEMLGSTSRIYLLAKPEGTPAYPGSLQARVYARHWTPIHLDFVVEDIGEALRSAEAAGARVDVDVQVRSWGKIATLSDPFGNGFCLVQFLGRGYDEIATSQAG